MALGDKYINFSGEVILEWYEEVIVDISIPGRAIYRTLTVRGIDTEDCNKTLRENIGEVRRRTIDKVGGNVLISTFALSTKYRRSQKTND